MISDVKLLLYIVAEEEEAAVKFADVTAGDREPRANRDPDIGLPAVLNLRSDDELFRRRTCHDEFISRSIVTGIAAKFSVGAVSVTGFKGQCPSLCQSVFQ